MALYSDVNYLNKDAGAIVEDVQSVYQAVFTLLNTKKGQRVFRPDYGGTLHNYLFEPCDEITAFKILQDIVTTLGQEPRVVLNISKTTVTPVPAEKKFYIHLIFTILGFGEEEKSLKLTLSTKKGN